MTGKSKIEAAAREAAEAYFLANASLCNVSEAVSFQNGYLAGHASRDEEVKAKDEELADWRESARRAAGETCGWEVHCSCVGPLRVEIATLRQKLAEANEVITHFTIVRGDRILNRECHTLLLDNEMTSAIIQAHNKETNV